MLKSLLRERRRSSAVHALGILGSAREASFDRFVMLAARSFDAPIALLSLIYGDTQWFKASHGAEIVCNPRHSSFCTFALDQPDILEICDPRADPRVAHLPVVSDAPFIRYYIGVPLRVTGGIDVGALCILDTRQRHPASPDQKAYLTALARQASAALEGRADLIQMGGRA
ncbi:GAF domain-containing protein [Sphingomonas yabuuchiae]|uniref:GAF domain-containing protein n=1 Tax=Sphingomonas yabuuchiae TaxID=172044 RepID=UPI003D9594B1